MSVFNIDAIMNQMMDAPLSTRVTPVPEGEYPARIGDTEDSVTLEKQQGKKDPTKSYLRIILQWEIIDEALKAHLGRERITVRDQFLLDTNPATGLLDLGPEKNIRLGARFEALGLNTPGTSIGEKLARLRGAGPAIIRVRHEGETEEKYAEVARVAPYTA